MPTARGSRASAPPGTCSSRAATRWTPPSRGAAGLRDRLAVGRQRHLDVVTGGVGVGTHAVGRPHELDGLLLILDRGQAHVELHGELEAALLGREQRHLGVDRDVARVVLRAPRDGGEGALEAGGETDGEQLLGVRAPAWPTELGGYA